MRTQLSMFVTVLSIAVSIVSAGCDSSPSAPEPGRGPGTPGPETPAQIDPGNLDHPIAASPTANYAGVYDVGSLLDLTQNGVLPGIASPALAALSELHDHPGDAIYTLLAGAGIPYVSDILAKVPNFLRSALTGALDDLIVDNVYEGYAVVDQIAGIVQGIAALSKDVVIHDYLTVGAVNADHHAVMQHQLTSAEFTYAGQKTTVVFSAAARLNGYAEVSGTIVPHADAPAADADISVPGGVFKLPVGEMMLSAAGPLLFARFGGATNLTQALINLVPCATFAQQISDSLDNVISGSDVQQICEAGLGLVAQEVDDAVKTVTLDNVVLSTVNGELYDRSIPRPAIDDQSDRFAEGVGTWTFAVGGGTAATVPSSFAGDRFGP